MTRVVCVSDLHENLPVIPECDLLCIAGDITFGFKGSHVDQNKFLINEFSLWFHQVPAKEIAIVAGNHDQCIEAWGWPKDGRSPSGDWDDMPGTYLQDWGMETESGLKVYGTPWQPYFFNWAFNSPERHGEAFLKERFDLIPDDTDIVICHGPPYGYGDRVGNPNVEDRSGQPQAGSRALTDALRRVNPRLAVVGHIHSGRGVYNLHGKQTRVANCALVNNNYDLVYEPMVFDL